jgi:hypothetical protein
LIEEDPLFNTSTGNEDIDPYLSWLWRLNAESRPMITSASASF